MPVNMQQQIDAALSVYQSEIADLMRKVSQAAIQNVTITVEAVELKGQLEAEKKAKAEVEKRVAELEEDAVKLNSEISRLTIALEQANQGGASGGGGAEMRNAGSGGGAGGPATATTA